MITAVNDPAMAGGFDLATFCDIRIASEKAVFGHPEIKFGLPVLYSLLRLIVGDGLAKDLCLTGRRIEGAKGSLLSTQKFVLGNLLTFRQQLPLCYSLLDLLNAYNS